MYSPTDTKTRRSTIADIASVCGVSKAVVSQVLAGRKGASTTRYSKATAQRVRQIARSLHYRPTLAGRIIHQGRTGLLGIVLPGQAEVYLAGLLPGCLRKAKELGYELIVGMDDLYKPNYTERLSVLLDRDVDGVILFPSRDFENSPLHQELLSSHRAAVLVEHNIQTRDLDFVGMDDRASYRVIIEHLVGLGHQRIGLIYEDEEQVPAAHTRRMEFDQAVDEADLPVLPRYYFPTPINLADDVIDRIAKGVGDYTALVVRGDRRACRVYEALRQRGVRIPEDLSMVVISGRDYSRDRLRFTSMRTAVSQIGAIAAELLVQRLQQLRRNIQNILVPGAFQVGQTTCRPGTK